MSTVSENCDKTVTFTDSEKLSKDISSVHLDQKFSDVTLIIGDQKICAHKVILAARSKYFENLLNENAQQNEIAIRDISFGAIQTLLQYVYTGTMSISSDVKLTLEVLGFAHRHSFKDLESHLIKAIRRVLNLENVYSVMDAGILHSLTDLEASCLSFMDLHALEIISSDSFSTLPQNSIIKLLKRDTFFAPEIQIFENVAKWCKSNEDPADLVKMCVRYSSLTVVDLVSVVWPSKLMDNEDLLSAIAEIVGVGPRLRPPRALLVMDENLATLQHDAEVVSGTDTACLLIRNRNVNTCASHIIDGNSGIVVKLKKPFFLNHISMMLGYCDTVNCSYYIEVSFEGKNWSRVIDYSHFACRSIQDLYFDQQIVQFIKVVGVPNNAAGIFHLVFFEAYFKSEVPDFVNGIIRPKTNVATLEKKAEVIQGIEPNILLNGDKTHYSDHQGYTYHRIGDEGIVVQLPQPYMISSMGLLLWDRDDRSYRYFIETSINKKDWEIAVNKRSEDCKSWQNHRFEERAVVFIRITGTHNTANKGFHCVHFECPSQDNESF